MEFKRCSCQTSWANRRDFILDPDVDPIGISLSPDLSSSHAFFFFNHSACKTTLVIDSEDFADLITEPIPARVKAESDGCEGHCAKKKDLENCSAECRNAPFRRFFIERILPRKI